MSLGGDPKTAKRGKRLNLKSKYKIPATTRYQNAARKGTDLSGITRSTKDAEWKRKNKAEECWMRSPVQKWRDEADHPQWDKNDEVIQQSRWEENKEIIFEIKANSALLESKHRFRPEFDLADCLIGIRQKYLQDSARPTIKEAIDQYKENIDEAFEAGSLNGLTDFDKLMLVFCGGLERMDEPTDARGRNELRKSIRALRKHDRKVVLANDERKAGGRYEDFATATVIRSLVVALYRATGELPRSGQASVLGPYTAFVRDACKALQIKVSDRAFKYHMTKILKPLSETEKPMLERATKNKG